jgi:hypothetical protein
MRTAGYSNRPSYCVRWPDEQIVDTSYNAAQNAWILETVHD